MLVRACVRLRVTAYLENHASDFDDFLHKATSHESKNVPSGFLKNKFLFAAQGDLPSKCSFLAKMA